MDDKASSYRRILESSSIIGAALTVNILIGLVRTKIIAVLLGPTGVGLVGLYTGLMSTATAVVGMGIGTTGTRQIAEALSTEDARAVAVVRHAMFWGTLVLAGGGALGVWLLREVLAAKVLGGVEHAALVGWLAVGVALSVAGGAQGALIQGMRRVGDMARLSVFGSAINTALGVAFLWLWGHHGLVAYVLIGPLVSFLLGHWYVSRLPKVASGAVAMRELVAQWQILLRLGVPFMGAGLANAAVQLWMRIEVGDTLGAQSLGHFQAASTISMQYIGFVLTAMAADYYPRLTGLIHAPEAANRLVNEQTEIALLLSAPVFIAMIGLAPWVLQLLYSAEFTPAVEVLRWQIVGDVLKVASWPLGFVILAAGGGKTFFLIEALVGILMGGLIAVFSYRIGLPITGIAFLVSCVVLLPLVYWAAQRTTDFRWTTSNIKLVAFIFVLCSVVALVSARYWWGSVVTVLISLAVGLYSVGRIADMSNIGGPVGRLALVLRRIKTRL